jgi:hypothetical protein
MCDMSHILKTRLEIILRYYYGEDILRTHCTYKGSRVCHLYEYISKYDQRPVLEPISSPKIMSDCLPRQSETLTHVPGTDQGFIIQPLVLTVLYCRVRSVTQLVISKNIVWSLPVLFIIQLFMLFYIWYLLCSWCHCFLSMLRGEFFIKSSAPFSHDFLRTHTDPKTLLPAIIRPCGTKHIDSRCLCR